MDGFNLNTISDLYVGGTKASAIYIGDTLLWPLTPKDYSLEYLTFEVLDNNTTFSFTTNDLKYSIDGGTTWTTLTAGSASPALNSGDTIKWKASNLTVGTDGMGTFSSTGQFNAYGNVMSLVGEDNFANLDSIANNQFFDLFYQCTNIVSAENLVLPATTLAQSCYTGMFGGCTSLIVAPTLPATTLAKECYCLMFQNCTSLTTAPALPATTLVDSCYKEMFRACTRLTNAPNLPATTLAQYCYAGMFEGCTSLTTAPALPATVLAQYCYQSMFSDCTSLTSAPTLPAAFVTVCCYRGMFSDCTSLTTAPTLPATTLLLATSCYQGMFAGCTSLTTAPALPATTLANNCYNAMFSRCTGLTTAPALPATTLKTTCYQEMFSGCTSLTTAPALPATTLAIRCYLDMFNGCTNLTAAPTLSATTLAQYCYAGMFSGCTSLTSAPDLPATTLAQYCYEEMFKNCTSLNYIKCYATDMSAGFCINNWVNGVAASGTFYKVPTTTWTSGNSGIPNGWTINDIVLPTVTISDVNNALEGEGPTINSGGYVPNTQVHLEWSNYNYSGYDPSNNTENMFDITVTPSNLNYEFVYGYDNGGGDAQNAYLSFAMPASNVSFTFEVVPNPDYNEGGDYQIDITGSEYLDPENIPDYANEGDQVYLYAGAGYYFAGFGTAGTGIPLNLDLDGDTSVFYYDNETTAYFTMPGWNVGLNITEVQPHSISYNESSYLDGNEPSEAYREETVTLYPASGYYFGDENTDVSNGLIVSISGNGDGMMEPLSITVNGTSADFTMPDADVSIDLNLLTHNITYTGSEYLDGTEPQQSNQNQQVTITCTEGYYFADSGQTGEGTPLHITIIDGDGMSVTPDMVYDTWFSFTMPYSDADVTISE